MEEEENEQRYMQVERDLAYENIRVSGDPKRECKEIFQHIEGWKARLKKKSRKERGNTSEFNMVLWEFLLLKS